MNKNSSFSILRFSCTLLFIIALSCLTACGVYTFHDVSIPDDVKTVKINFIENKARYINPQLSPKLTDALQQKITNLTKLNRTNNDNADYIIGGTIITYNVSTSGISSQQAATNRLTVGAEIIFTNSLTNKVDNFRVSRDFDFAASLTLPQAENQLLDEIVKNITDEIFNHIFSSW